MGHVQRQIGEFHPALEHHLGSLRIGEQVEFSHRGDVATVEMRPAHDHHFLDALNDFRLLDQCQSQVGLRTEHGNGDAVRFGRFKSVDQIIDRIAFRQAFLRFVNRDA